MLPFIGRKKHEAAVLRDQALIAAQEEKLAALQERLFEQRQTFMREETLLKKHNQENLRFAAELQNGLQEAITARGKAEEQVKVLGERTTQAEAACKVAATECARIVACHATRIRVGHIPFDPITLTMRIRTVQSGLRAEWDGDKMVFYSDKQLTESEYNALIAALPGMNRT